MLCAVTGKGPPTRYHILRCLLGNPRSAIVGDLISMNEWWWCKDLYCRCINQSEMGVGTNALVHKPIQTSRNWKYGQKSGTCSWVVWSELPLLITQHRPFGTRPPLLPSLQGGSSARTVAGVSQVSGKHLIYTQTLLKQLEKNIKQLHVFLFKFKVALLSLNTQKIA